MGISTYEGSACTDPLIQGEVWPYSTKPTRSQTWFDPKSAFTAAPVSLKADCGISSLDKLKLNNLWDRIANKKKRLPCDYSRRTMHGMFPPLR